MAEQLSASDIAIYFLLARGERSHRHPGFDFAKFELAPRGWTPD
jgi:predicted cupin superfamily sugar epimerase